MHLHHICTMEQNKPNKREGSKKNFFLRWLEVSHKNPRTKMYFRSMASIEKEQRRQRMLKFNLVIHPLSMFRLYYENFFVILSYITLCIIPLHLMISPFSTMTELKDKLAYAELICDIMYFVDFILNFFTGCNNPLTKNYALTPREISKLYVRTNTFYYDLLTSYPKYIVRNIVLSFFPSIAQNSLYAGAMTLVSVLTIFRLKQFIKYYNRTTEVFRRMLYLRFTIKYLLLTSLILHWMTCIFCIVATFKDSYINKEDVIIPTFSNSKPNFLKFPYYTMYFQALLIVVSYVLGIKLVNSYRRSKLYEVDSNEEILIFIFYSLLGYLMCNIFLVMITQLILSMNSSGTKYYSTISQLKTYMKCKDLPMEMRDRMLTYYEYRFRRKYFTENTMNDILSVTLCKEIIFYTRQKFIENVPVLKDLPSDTISLMVENLKHEVYLYNDVIVKAGVLGNSMYFIVNGTVAVKTGSGKEICHLQDGDFFGSVAMVSKDNQRITNILAIEICEVYRLERSAFKACFPINSPHFRKFEQVAIKRMEKAKLVEEIYKEHLSEKPMFTYPSKITF